MTYRIPVEDEVGRVGGRWSGFRRWWSAHWAAVVIAISVVVPTGGVFWGLKACIVSTNRAVEQYPDVIHRAAQSYAAARWGDTEHRVTCEIGDWDGCSQETHRSWCEVVFPQNHTVVQVVCTSRGCHECDVHERQWDQNHQIGN